MGLNLLALGLLTGLLNLIQTQAELLVLAQEHLQAIFTGPAVRGGVGEGHRRGGLGHSGLSKPECPAQPTLSAPAPIPNCCSPGGNIVPDRVLLAATARFGAVSALHQSGLYLGKLLVQGAVNTLDTPGINAYTATMRIEGFVNSFGDSGCAAVSVFVGQNTSAGEERRVKRGFFSGLGLLLVLGVVMSAVMFFGARELSILLLPQGEGQELAYSADYLRTVSVFYALCFAGNALVGYFQGCGRCCPGCWWGDWDFRRSVWPLAWVGCL